MKDENDKYIRFDHAAANTEAVPFVTDEKIYTVRDKQQLIASALSSRDVEIREVLEGLRSECLSSEYECWCSFRRGFHTNACLAARGLWNRVQS